MGAPRTLREAVEQLEAGRLDAPDGTTPPACAPVGPDLSDVVGQDAARRALEIAAAGEHGMLFIGPPGAGKTLLARCMPSVLPTLTEPEALESIAIHSVAGLFHADRVGTPQRAFRAPHHTISVAGLVGGGTGPRPGEVSLAHRGVLFLDELLEFPRHILDAMRQPLEDGHVTIARASKTVRFPAEFTLVGAMNPCPCGWWGDASNRCVCSAGDVRKYQSRLSGPLSDRIDLHLSVKAVAMTDLAAPRPREGSAAVRARVDAARARQRARYTRLGSGVYNGRVPGRWLDRETRVCPRARSMLATAADRLALSARGYHRVLKVARTIADLDGADAIESSAIAEALRYRPPSPGR
jgi:magnesium chelatase family protein